MTQDPDEVDLDPDNWHMFSQISHDMVDLFISYLQNIRDRKVWQPIPDSIKTKFESPVPLTGTDLASVLEEFEQTILPYPTGNIHPRFWGWVHGTGTPTGALAEFLAAMMNPNTGGREHIANYVERQVVNWLKEILGYDHNASGIFTSGCSMANLTGLAVARQMKSPIDIRKEGLSTLPKPLTVYGSDQMHSSIQKALEVLGMGSQSLRVIPSNDHYELDLSLLESQIQEDLASDYHPIAVVGNVGTVNSGAIDDLSGISELAVKYDLWFHIDGAFGALARLLQEYSDPLTGFERADSVAFDLHKWMYLPYEIGCILVKNDEAHRGTFSLRPDYLSQQSRGLASFDHWPTEYGVELSRGFRALKAWISFKEYGVNRYRQVISKNIRQARYLGELVENHSDLEVMAPVSLNVVCFRYNPQGRNISAEQLEAINQEILLRVQESGTAVFSSTSLKGTYTLRVANTNQRSQFSDFDLLSDVVVSIGSDVISDLL